MKNQLPYFDAVTVTFNPAIDRTIAIPGLTIGVVNRGEEISVQPAGKGVNVASALADYGLGVAVTGFLGNDNAAFFEELFKRKNIEDCFVRIPGLTRIGIKIIDPATRETTDLNLPGLTPTPADLKALVQRLDNLDAGYFILSGSLPPGVDPAIYGDLIGRLHARGKKVVLDASGEPLRHAIEAKPYLIKPNIHELEGLLGGSLPDYQAVIKAARRFIARGIGVVVVSMGGKGACFVTADMAVIARPPAVEVKSTVGAGDAMVAGIVAGLLAEMPLLQCARLATAFSLEVLARGRSGITSRGSIESLMERVMVVEWK